ncbi:glycine betaine/proline transport system substrate-binding protein [Chitinophaga jiangningensis]|uniref:Glycine betaine/proline transport system substrate-binding protein n=1 Tax=Chitinophaga jiangningensis TaxID=1419482 RepID=A0A1M7KV44_9BACT|nr:glycine betaine ABC transporter substrate-binding protein [Chitinophaga jiangningensis]SHM69407.1 glycine betaine/proline transport system substrate-binding protein [Chitinophaga jiangningensis]
MNKRTILTAFFALLILGFTACQQSDSNTKKITIAYVNWSEGQAMTYLAKNLLEKKGYKVTLKNADVAPVFAAVASGDADIFMDAWMPVTHKAYMSNFGEKITVLNTIFDGARIGLVVPDYSAAKTIEDLQQMKSKFGGKIVGIDAGAGIMKSAEEAIISYGLDYQLQTSSEAAMLAVLKKNIDEKQEVVVTGWQPHLMFSQFKLRFLEDPKKAFGEPEKILTIANNEFTVTDTTAVNFFRKFKLNAEQLSSLIAAIADADWHEEEGVKNWISKNQAVIATWE